jgi:hypothetical protein
MANINEISELIDLQIERYRSILGIPRRKGNNLAKDIEQILKIIVEMKTLEKIEYTVCREFNIKKNTFNYVLPTLERANLIMKGDVIKVTFAGSKFINENNIAYVARGFLENYYGLLEILLLISEKKVSSRKEIFNEWVKLYENEFGLRTLSTHISQYNIIIRYLIGFDLLYKIDQYYKVNEENLRSYMEVQLY